MTAQPAAPRPNHLTAVPAGEDERAKALAELTAAVVHHEDQAARHQAAADAAKQAIMKLHGQRGKTIDVGELKVTWKAPSRSFAKDEFVKAYPAEANPTLYTTPDPVLDTSAIPPNLKNQFMRPGSGEGTIVIK